jgi:hypothetical protein
VSLTTPSGAWRQGEQLRRDLAAFGHLPALLELSRTNSSRKVAEMPSTNGHGPKRAILYACVTTDEQARNGFSLGQQLEALCEYASREAGTT